MTQILGYKPSTLVTIEYLPDMGDWKTAWDHIHFQGFLGAKMALQFTWQGCDSLLAAPLAIDLARLADLEKRRGGRGLLKHLACFFKSPEGIEENDFFKQFDLLVEHLKAEHAPADGSGDRPRRASRPHSEDRLTSEFMRHGLTSRLVILSCFGALFLACYAPALFRDRQFAYRDAGNYYYPLNKRVQAEWNAGRWPLWEPEENAGMPLLGNPTAAVLYPGKLVFAILPYAWGARTYVVAHSALAFLSMLVLMRSWGTSWFGSALSALVLCVWGSDLVSVLQYHLLDRRGLATSGNSRRRSLGSSGPAVGPSGAGDRLVDAGAGGRPAGRLPPGTGRHRLCLWPGVEPGEIRTRLTCPTAKPSRQATRACPASGGDRAGRLVRH